jgi:hypothetical protein
MVLIRHKEGLWHEPDTSAYASEKALQDLVKLSPSLLPGGYALAVVDEFWVPGIGSADLVGVSAAGDITIVECKLKANPEIRREVVGQTLAYAGGLWRMAYDDFEATFAARGGLPLATAITAATGEDVDENVLRANVSRRLADGEFKLVIAVDAITPELRLIIQYLNEHTLSSVQVLGLELAYGRDGDVELLIPTVYGEEAAERKSRSSATGSKWTAATFAEQIQARTTGSVRELLERLLEHGTQKGHHPFYGSGATPGMSYYYDVAGTPTSVWALYLNEPVPKVALSFGSISKNSTAAALSMLHRLNTNPKLASALAEIDDSSLSKYPQIGVDLLVDPEAQSVFFSALDDLTGGMSAVIHDAN